MEKHPLSDENVGILLIGHGSSLPYGRKVIYNLSKMYKEYTDFPVEVGFMNIEDPTIRAAINTLAEKGVSKIIAVPVFIAHGVHTKQDINYMLGLGKAREDAYYNQLEQEEIKFDGELVYLEPLGPDPRIADIIEDRVKDALKS